MYSGKKGTKKSYPTRRRSSGTKRPLNGFEAEGNSKEVSASAKKLNMVNEDFGNRILTFVTVFSVISQHVKCKTCDSDIPFHERSPRGLGFKIVIACPNCPDVVIPSCKFINNAYEINLRIVIAMRLLGVGLNGILKFCAFMELPRPIFQSFYDRLVDSISIATGSVRDVSMKKTAEKEKEICVQNGQLEGITVSGDGSLRKRGLSPLFGVTSLIGWHTGKIVDFVVKFKYCKACEYWKSTSRTSEYNEWIKTHADQFQANHEGSSGKMEVDAVTKMLKRSESLHGLKYANYIGLEAWCDWTKTQAAGALSDYHHKALISEEVFEAIKPVHDDLSRNELLNRCLGGFTQNSNETFNAAVWNLAPKVYSSVKKVLNIAMDIAVCNFNDGVKSF